MSVDRDKFNNGIIKLSAIFIMRFSCYCMGGIECNKYDGYRLGKTHAFLGQVDITVNFGTGSIVSLAF